MPATTGSYPEANAEGLPHTFACSTIGPAELNLRRFAGVSEAGPAVEICVLFVKESATHRQHGEMEVDCTFTGAHNVWEVA
jgi:hypothetical protein